MAKRTKTPCATCGHTGKPVRHRTLGIVCRGCLSAVGDSKAARRRERRKAREELRLIASSRLPANVHDPYATSHPGNPLGPGFPVGASLREDTESHREAWQRIVRADPCSYCGRPGGTLDHIDPQTGPRRDPWGLHAWTNYAGACERCNGGKKDTPLFLWLARRPVLTLDTRTDERKAA